MSWCSQQAKCPKKSAVEYALLVVFLLHLIMQRQYHPPSPELRFREPEKVPGSKEGEGRRKVHCPYMHILCLSYVNFQKVM